MTTRCQHRCAHCCVDFARGGVTDMPEETLALVLEKCARAGLLTSITLLGGEPFIDPDRLLAIIDRIWRLGAGTLEIFIPTNGRWAAGERFEETAAKLLSLAQWFPHGLRVVFSQNEWNMAQLGDLAPLVQKRWTVLGAGYPETFYHRQLARDELLPHGGARKNDLSCPGAHVGVGCSFDDWYDPGLGGGFLMDYLAFYPNGQCGLCYVYQSPVIGEVGDDFDQMLKRRREYLVALRRHLTGADFGSLGPEACLKCPDFYVTWAKSRGQTGAVHAG